MRDIST